MRHHQPAAVGLLAAGLLLAGCTSTPTPDSTTTPTASTPAQSTPAASSPNSTPNVPTTLTPEQQKAVKDATNAVMAARQIGVDLYSGARTRINDLDDVTTGDFHDETVRGVSLNLAQGWKSTPKGVQLKLVSAEPVKVNLTKDPPTVVIRACIDGSDVVAVKPGGSETRGVREVLDYTVVYTTERLNPKWAVSKATGAADPKDRAC